MNLNDDSQSTKSKFKARNSKRLKTIDKLVNFLIKVKTFASEKLLYILDFLALAIYFLFYSLGASGLITLRIYDGAEVFVINCLPMIIAVISIILTLKQEKIFGLTYKELNLIRSKHIFKFDHMLYVSIGIFALTLLSVCFNNSISLIVLSIVTLIYVSCFVYQEMVVLLDKENSVKKILIKAYKQALFAKKETQNLDKKIEIINRGITNIVLTYGYLETIEKECRNYFKDCEYNELIKNINILLYNYLNSIVSNKSELLGSSNRFEFKENLSLVVNSLFNDLSKIFDGGLIHDDIYLEKCESYFEFFVVLKKIEESYDLRIRNNQFINCFNLLSYTNNDLAHDSNSFARKTNYYIYLSVYSIHRHELSFFKVLWMKINPDLICIKSNVFAATEILSTYIILYWYCKYGKEDEKFKVKIKNFLMDQRGNSDFKYSIGQSIIANLETLDFYFALKVLFKIYDEFIRKEDLLLLLTSIDTAKELTSNSFFMEIFYTIYFLHLKPIKLDYDKLKDNREYLIRLDELIEENHFREFINEYRKKTLDSQFPFIGAKKTVNLSDAEYPEKINNLLKAIKIAKEL